MDKERIQALALIAVEAIAAGAELAERKNGARDKAIAAIRGIERALDRVRVEAGLAAFNGLPNIGSGNVALRGLNVRAKDPRKPLDRPGWRGHGRPPAAALVLGAHGKLQIAQLGAEQRELALGVREADDLDFTLDDVELVAEAAIKLLRLQTETAHGKHQILASAELLAANLDAALNAWGNAEPVAAAKGA